MKTHGHGRQLKLTVTDIRMLCTAITTADQWFWSFLISRTTPYMITSLGYGTYMFFGALMVLMGFWALFFIPETKGKYSAVTFPKIHANASLQALPSKTWTDSSCRALARRSGRRSCSGAACRRSSRSGGRRLQSSTERRRRRISSRSSRWTVAGRIRELHASYRRWLGGGMWLEAMDECKRLYSLGDGPLLAFTCDEWLGLLVLVQSRLP